MRDVLLLEGVVLQDDLERASLIDNGLIHRFDLLGDVVPLSTEHLPNVNQHVDFVGAGLRGGQSLRDLDFGGAVTMWEGNNGANEHSTVRENGLGDGDAVWLDAGSCDLVVLGELETALVF